MRKNLEVSNAEKRQNAHRLLLFQAFEELAKALGTSFVLIDLRAGLSELASPLLFDPRLERYLVTTLSEQSVSGTCLVLKSLASMMPD